VVFSKFLFHWRKNFYGIILKLQKNQRSKSKGFFYMYNGKKLLLLIYIMGTSRLETQNIVTLNDVDNLRFFLYIWPLILTVFSYLECPKIKSPTRKHFCPSTSCYLYPTIRQSAICRSFQEIAKFCIKYD